MAHLDPTTGYFTQGNLFRHVSVMSITSSIGLMAIFAVDLIDLAFIAMLGREELAAAAGYASVLMFFASAVNIGVSIAAGTLVAQAEGRGDAATSRDYATSTAVIAGFVGLLLPVLMLPFLDELLGLLRASGAVIEMAESYLWIILPSTFLSGLSMVAVAVLRAHGDARGAMYPALLGAFANALFDPLMIFLLDMGLDGAALATVFARIVTAVVAVWLVISRYRAFAWPRPACVMRNLRAVSAIAVPAVLGTVATPVGTAILTREMAKYGADAVAGMAVINRLVPVVFSVVLALSGALGPIFGQNFGAGRMDRVRRTFIDGILFLAFYVSVVSFALFILRAPIADLFGATGETRSLLYLFLGPLALASFFNGMIAVSNATFNSLGHATYASVLNWGRHTLGTWPLALAFGAIWGAHGVLVGQAVGGAIFALIAGWISLRIVEAPCLGAIRSSLTCPFKLGQMMNNRYFR